MISAHVKGLMSSIAEKIVKKGYIPLSCDMRGGISWQGEYLPDFWMWNRQFTEHGGGAKYIQTVRVTELKEAALRLWRDKWIPLKPIDEDLLRRMEEALRRHKGLRNRGEVFPDTPFLEMPDPIDEKFCGPEVKAYLKIPEGNAKRPPRKAARTKKGA